MEEELKTPVDATINNKTKDTDYYLKKATKQIANEIFSTNCIVKWLFNTPINTEITMDAKGTMYSYTVMCVKMFKVRDNITDMICSLVLGPANNLTKFSIWHVTVDESRFHSHGKIMVLDIKHIDSAVVTSLSSSKKFTNIGKLKLTYKLDSGTVNSIYGCNIPKNDGIISGLRLDVTKSIDSRDSKLNKNNITIFPGVDSTFEYPEFDKMYSIDLLSLKYSIGSNCFSKFKVNPKFTLLRFNTVYPDDSELGGNFFFAIFTLSESSNTKGINGSTLLSIDEATVKMKGFKDFIFNSAVKYAKSVYKMNKKKEKSVKVSIKKIKDKIQIDKNKSKEVKP